MARIIPDPQDPSAFPRARGVFYVREWKGRPIAQKWPRKRPETPSWPTYWYREQFKYAAWWASDPEPNAYATAVHLAEGTEYVPRDILMMAAYGKLYTVIDPDGNQWHPARHDPPSIPGPMEIEMPYVQWMYDNAITGTASTTAFAWKGHVIAPQKNIQVFSIAAAFAALTSAAYRYAIMEVNGARQIQSIIFSDTFVSPDTTVRFRPMPIDALLEVGKLYWIAVGRIDGSATYVLPVRFATQNGAILPATLIEAARLASTNPTVGATYDAGTAGQCNSMAMLATF